MRTAIGFLLLAVPLTIPFTMAACASGGNGSSNSSDLTEDAGSKKKDTGLDDPTPTPSAKPDASRPPPTDAGRERDAGPTCAARQTLCSGTCIDNQTDVNNCGKCGNKCQAGATCQRGACTTSSGTKSCATGLQLCNGSCTTTFADPLNCGTCGHMCNLLSGQTCVLGTCKSIFGGGGSSSSSGGSSGHGGGSCDPNYYQSCNGQCIPWTDRNNCGACGNWCYSDEYCDGWNCVYNGGGGGSSSSGGSSGGSSCDPNYYQVCGGDCIPWDDPYNCGGCGNYCDGYCDGWDCYDYVNPSKPPPHSVTPRGGS
jgi:Stigma-specific protein, Stig1